MNNKIITCSFCESFIDRLAGHLETEYIKPGKDLARVAVVFGGKRPALFLKKELARRLGTSFVPPRFFTIDEFVTCLVRKTDRFTATQDLDNCYLLYKIAQKAVPAILEGRESFAQFLPWTREILKFIDQLDLEHIEDKALLNIQANAQIGYSVPEDINRLLGHIARLRQAYHQEIETRKFYSRGFQYRQASRKIKDVEFAEFDQVIFGNFFYFNRSEEMMIQGLYDRGLATLIFQGDERKWPVLERISRRLGCRIEEGEDVPRPAFKLQLHEGFDSHSQIGLAREVLKKIGDKNKTVVVLPDPDQVVGLLAEITGFIKEFNISMGYPLKRSSLYSLFRFVFQAQLSKKQDRYYAKDYLKALRHPFVKNLRLRDDDHAAAVTRTLIHKIEEVLTGKVIADISGSLFFALDEVTACEDIYRLAEETLTCQDIPVTRNALKETLTCIHKVLFAGWEEVETFRGFADVLKVFLDMFVQKSFLKKYPLNINIAQRMYQIHEELTSAAFAGEDFPREDLFRIFENKVSREIMAFKGSPLKGMQVLGLFETRALNFENVIIIDMNEGVLPYLQIQEPLIPREVMISLGLERLELEEEIQRYQFMRLISSAKNVHLVYQKSREKERSRFVEELVWEQQKAAGKPVDVPVTPAHFQARVLPAHRKIVKTPAMIKHLRNLRYSASSVNTYLRDPMEFYLRYVLGLREQDDLLDEPEARHVGTFVHELLEESFQPFLKKPVKIDARFRQRFEKRFDEKFAQRFGRNSRSEAFLMKRIVAERLGRFLEKEATSEDRRVEEILCLEGEFEDEIPLSCGDIKFKYIVDRIDRLVDGTVMIIDYKTGSIDQMPQAAEKVAGMDLSRENIFKQVRSFQIPLYFYYLERQYPDTAVNAALYNLRTLEIKPFLSAAQTRDVGEVNKVFLRALDFTLSEILNPNVPFEAAV